VTITNNPFAGGVTQGQGGRYDGIICVGIFRVLDFNKITNIFVGHYVMCDITGGKPLWYSYDGTEDGVYCDMIIDTFMTENKVAIVSIVSMINDTKLTARRNHHQVERIVGTQYVWIDGTN